MIPEPLHPAIVHFPIVLMTLLPVVALVALWSIRRGIGMRAAWFPVVAIAGALVVSSWIAVETGEREEEVAERVVPESAIHEHQERAELFLPLAVGVLIISMGGLLNGRPGEIGRMVAALAAIALFVPGYRVGASGGDLVYEHGAAAAYATGSSGPDLTGEHEEDEDDHRR